MDEDASTFAKVKASQDWGQARRRASIENMMAFFSSKSPDLLPFEEVRKQLRLSQKHYKGMYEIPLDQIRGSVGRYQDFTQTFLPRKESMRQRWERVNAVSMTIGLPPIEVYQVGEAYFVLDGNHRVSIARQNDAKFIEAHVWEFPTAVGLSAEADLDEVLVKAEYTEFLNNTALDKSRPEQDIVLTGPGCYRALEYQIELYRQALEQIDEETISYQDAAAAWYDMIYTPAVQIIEQHGMLERFPDRTEADLFNWVWRHHKELQTHGIDSIAQDTDSLTLKPPFHRRLWQTLTGWLRKS
jgi:hypothetical protein